MAIYAQKNFEQIAAASDTRVEEIAKHAQSFEAAALWYRLGCASPHHAAPSILRRKLDRIAKNAGRLLVSLSVVDLDEAVDGPRAFPACSDSRFFTRWDSLMLGNERICASL